VVRGAPRLHGRRGRLPGLDTSLPAGYEAAGFGFEDSTTLSAARLPITLDNTIRYVIATTAPAYARWRSCSANGTAATPAAGASRLFSKLAVYGNHGIGRYTGDTSEPDGLRLSTSSSTSRAAGARASTLSGVQANPYVVQHLAFTERTFPYDAFLELNKYALWHLGVWEKKRLDFRAVRPHRLRLGDPHRRPGDDVQPAGPVDREPVQRDRRHLHRPLTGRVDTITPETTAASRTREPVEPVEPGGDQPLGRDHALEPRRTRRAPSTRSGRPRSLTATGRGHRERSPSAATSGTAPANQQPCWKVRAGDTIAITNFPNDTPRLIVETDYDDETKTNRLAIDQPFALLDAYLDRQANALQAAGLA
jgi:hypothetical protein